MQADSQPSGGTSRLRAIFGRRTGRGVIAFGAASILAVPSGAWLGAPLHWRLDLVGNLAAHVLPIVALATIWWTVRRFPAAALMGWASVCVLVWPLSTGRARWTRGDGPGVRVLVYNSMVGAPSLDDEVRVVEDSAADFVALVEPSDPMVGQTRTGGRLRRAYPYTAFRHWGGDPPSSYQVLLSRWPLTRPDGRSLDEPCRGVVEAIAEAPWGRTGLVVIHPRSPRSPGRWRDGLAEADLAAAAARRFTEAGLPVIVMGDLNSTPSGLVSRRLCSRGGLRRCKPWLTCRGTFPVDRVWPLRVAIDDTLVSPDVSVSSWDLLDPAGSDHTPVLVGLSVPRGTAAGR